MSTAPAGPAPELLAKGLRKFLAAVEGSGFKYATIGDVAGLCYGTKLPPRNVEVLVAFEGPQRENILSAARGEGLSGHPDGEPFHLQYHDAKIGGSADVHMVQAVTPFHRQVLSRSQPSGVLGVSAKTATCEDLILLRAGREEERDRVADLLRSWAARLDAAYVKKEADAAGIMDKLKAAWVLAKSQG